MIFKPYYNEGDIMKHIIYSLKQLKSYLKSCQRAGEPVHGHIKTVEGCIKYFENENPNMELEKAWKDYK